MLKRNRIPAIREWRQMLSTTSTVTTAWSGSRIAGFSGRCTFLKGNFLCNFFITGILFFLQNNLFGSHIHDGLAVAFKEDAFRLVLRIDEG